MCSLLTLINIDFCTIFCSPAHVYYALTTCVSAPIADDVGK